MNEHWTQHPVVRGYDTVQPIFDTLAGRGYIAGSYAAFMAYPGDCPILPNDIDIFATTDANSHALAVELNERLKGRRPIPMIESTCAVWSVKPESGLDIQIVRPNPKWQSWPDDILEDFDMNICRAVLFTPNTVLGDHDAGQKWGKFLRINDPLRSLKRAMKYNARGVEFNDHELLKLFRAWDEVAPEKRAKMVEEARVAYEPIEGVDYNVFEDDDWFEGE